MAAKKPLPIVDTDAEPVDEPKPEAIRIVSLEEATSAPADNATHYWIGEKGVIPFDDGTSLPVKDCHVYVTEPSVIKNLDIMAKFPGNPYKIFKQ